MMDGLPTHAHMDAETDALFTAGLISSDISDAAPGSVVDTGGDDSASGCQIPGLFPGLSTLVGDGAFESGGGGFEQLMHDTTPWMAARKAAADARATACRTTRICACAAASGRSLPDPLQKQKQENCEEAIHR